MLRGYEDTLQTTFVQSKSQSIRFKTPRNVPATDRQKAWPEFNLNSRSKCTILEESSIDMLRSFALQGTLKQMGGITGTLQQAKQYL